MMRKLPIFLTAILIASSLHAEEVHYSGSHLCSKGKSQSIRWDEWRITFGAQGPEAADVLYRERGRRNYTRKSGPLEARDGAFVLYKKKNRAWVSADFSEDRETLNGVWLESSGKPHRQCEPFTLTRTTPPVERIDALAALYETPEPTVEDFVAAAHQRDSMPPLDLLPALDRQAYADRLSDARPAFEARFDAAQTARIDGFDMGAEADRAALTAQTRAIVAPSLVETGALKDRGQFAMALRLFYRGADRLAESGTLDPLPLAPGDQTCAALTVFENSSRMEEVEMIVGLPFEYWDRPLAERVLATAEGCGARIITRTLTRNYPRIEERAVAAEWLRTEAARIAALPPTLETLRENDWLSLDNDALTFSMYHYGRFADPTLSEFRREAIADTVNRVTAAYSKPGNGKIADALCRDVPTRADAFEAVRDACDEGRQNLARVERQMQCHQAILDSGLDDATTATHLNAPAIDREAVPLRDWICEMSDEGGVTMSFDEGGGFFGSGLSLTMRFEDTGGTVAFTALLDPTEADKSVLEVTEIEAVEMMDGARLAIPKEGPHLCLFIPSACLAEVE